MQTSLFSAYIYHLQIRMHDARLNGAYLLSYLSHHYPPYSRSTWVHALGCILKRHMYILLYMLIALSLLLTALTAPTPPPLFPHTEPITVMINDRPST